MYRREHLSRQYIVVSNILTSFVKLIDGELSSITSNFLKLVDGFPLKYRISKMYELPVINFLTESREQRAESR